MNLPLRTRVAALLGDWYGEPAPDEVTDAVVSLTVDLLRDLGKGYEVFGTTKAEPQRGVARIIAEGYCAQAAAVERGVI